MTERTIDVSVGQGAARLDLVFDVEHLGLLTLLGTRRSGKPAAIFEYLAEEDHYRLRELSLVGAVAVVHGPDDRVIDYLLTADAGRWLTSLSRRLPVSHVHVH